MLAKTVVVSLMGLAAITEAATLHRPFDQIMQRRSAKALKSRQFGNGGFGGNFNGGNGFNNGGNGGDNGQDDNNGDQNNDNGNNNNNGGNNGGNQCLDQNVIATGSAQDGTAQSDDPDEAASLTDDANFINFCSGQTITNGLQNEDGSCNPIPMGQIPSTQNMISGILISPAHNDDVNENEDFDVNVQYTNLDAGTFTNPDNTYYSAPQQINGNGQIIGHTHVTIQDLGGSLTPNTPPDASQFVFFKGINDAGNGNGLLTAAVTGGLPAGNYRVCTMVSSSNHQPVLMPVAQRGAQDDCNKFTVGANGGNNNNGNNGNDDNNGDNGNDNNNNGGNGQ
ncbi:Pathogenicity cluster 5 protein d [Eutypa lata]|nr:Pathogenicity cluster 5 protein d [Eutypa lata]